MEHLRSNGEVKGSGTRSAFSSGVPWGLGEREVLGEHLTGVYIKTSLTFSKLRHKRLRSRLRSLPQHSHQLLLLDLQKVKLLCTRQAAKCEKRQSSSVGATGDWFSASAAFLGLQL